VAYDKIIPIRSRLDNCLCYTQNPEKTDLSNVLAYAGDVEKTTVNNTILETAINCQLETAYADMMETKRRWNKTGSVLGYHLIHSYAPGEVTPEQAHRLGVEFAQRLLGDRYEAVVSTHIDRNHLHCHIVFNSVSLVDGQKYRNNFRDYFEDIRGQSNAVSQDHGLSIIKPEGHGVHYAEWNAEQHGRATLRETLRQDIDAILEQSFTYKTFLSQLKRRGYAVKCGPNVRHTAVRPPGGSRYIRLDSLGEGYTEASIRERLAAGRQSGQQSPVRQKRYTVRRGNLQHGRKLHGFRALYFRWMFLIGGKQPSRRSVPFSVWKEVTKLERYQRQFRFLEEYRIETDGQLSMLGGAIQAQIDALMDKRKTLYQQRRQGQEVSAEIASVNESLRDRRKKQRICKQIEADIPDIRAKTELARGEMRQTEQAKEEKSHERGK